MDNLLLHPKTKQDVEAFVLRPAHAAVFVGEAGVGVGKLLDSVARQLLGIDGTGHVSEERLHAVQASEATISIDNIRKIQHFLSLKSTAGHKINRVVIIENAERMSAEAQNALLKTIEEPPVDSVILLGVASAQALLPTIMSRVQTAHIVKPDLSAIKQHLGSSYPTADIERALVMSGGQPALAGELLEQKADHPLMQAADQARSFLRATTFERLSMVDGLSKQRIEAITMCDMLARMATVALQKDGTPAKQQETWQRILKESSGAQQLLVNYAQPKLVLSTLALRA